MDPTVSVIIPVFNNAPYVRDAVQSVLKQTYGNFECLIFDDGSTDGSIDIVRKLAEADPRIRHFTEGHRGMTAWLNRGIELARAPYIARMDADDISLPTRFAKQVEYLENNPACVAVGCQAEIIDPEGDVIGPWIRPRSHEEIDAHHLAGQGAGLIHPSIMMRREVLRGIGGYRTQFVVAQDFDLLLRMAEVGRLANLPEVLLHYRSHESSVSTQKYVLQAEMTRSALADAGVRRRVDIAMPPAPHPPPPMKNAKVTLRMHWATTAIREGYGGAARKNAWMAVRRAPLTAAPWSVLVDSLAVAPRSGTRRVVRALAATWLKLLQSRDSLRRGVRKQLGRTPVFWRLVR